MFNQDFLARANVQQICEFIRSGSFLYPEGIEKGTLTQRSRRCEQEQARTLRAALEQMYDAGSRGTEEDAREKLIDALQNEIYFTGDKAENLSFEAGFLAGLWVGENLEEMR